MGLKVNARLMSEGTHWETMKERMYVCHNVQGRARSNIKRKTENGRTHVA